MNGFPNNGRGAPSVIFAWGYGSKMVDRNGGIVKKLPALGTESKRERELVVELDPVADQSVVEANRGDQVTAEAHVAAL